MTAPMIRVFLALPARAVPVVHAMIGGVAAAPIIEGKPMAAMLLRLYTPTRSFPMLAIPFFILAGRLMVSVRSGGCLVNIARPPVGGFKGGLGQVSILGSAMFGGASGPAAADASALGDALIPVRRKEGCPGGFAAAIDAASPAISAAIPPSTPLVLCGLVSSTSIVELFVAWVVPGLMLGIGKFAAVCRAARRKNLPRSPREKGLPRLPRPDRRRDPGAAHARLRDRHAALRHRDPDRGLGDGGGQCAHGPGAGLSRPDAAGPLGRDGRDGADDRRGDADHHGLVHHATGADGRARAPSAGGPCDLLLLRALDGDRGAEPGDAGGGGVSRHARGGAAAGALFVTIGKAIGLDPIQLGLMMAANLSIGLCAPPVGTALFISAAIARMGTGEVVKALAPFCLVARAVLGAICYPPWLTSR